MSAAHETAHDDNSGRALAKLWKLDYIEAYAVAVDPRALSMLPRADWKSLQAVPLAASGRGTLVALSTPSEDRFKAIRDRLGKHTRFAIVSERTLDALLTSRMFMEAAAGPAEPPAGDERAQTPVPEAATEAPIETHVEAHVAPAAAPSAPVVPAVATAVPDGDSLVEAVVAALERVLPAGGGGLVGASSVTPAEGSPGELLAQLDQMMETWSSVRAALANVDGELEDTKRQVRETKEQLSVAHAENDQHLNRVRALETELAESRSLLNDARGHLRDAFQALEGTPSPVTEPQELD
jgi:Type II secretion system (T2SS), protein E, N-terminal domain